MSDEERLARRAGQRKPQSDMVSFRDASDDELDRVLEALRAAVLAEDELAEALAAKKVASIRRGQMEEHLAIMKKVRRKKNPTAQEEDALETAGRLEADRIGRVVRAHEEPRRELFDATLRRADEVLRRYGRQ